MEIIYRDTLHRYTGRVFRYAATVASPRPLDDMLAEAVGRTFSAGGALPAHAMRGDADTVAAGYTVLRPRTPTEHEHLRDALATLEPVVLPDTALRHHLATDPDRRRHPLVLLRELVDRAEARSLFRLPIALDGYLPGFPVRGRPDPPRPVRSVDGPSVVLGYQGDRRQDEVAVAVESMSRHAFIVGTPGSGKTNTTLHLCRQLWNHRIPFLVIEPVNTGLNDYRWLATQPDFDDLLIFTVGNDSIAPFRLNPFEVPHSVTVAAHLSNLLACFEAAFGLWDPLPFIYRRALTRAYRKRDLHPDDRGGPEHAERWPMLADVVAALADVTDALGYSGELGHNIDAAVKLRAEALAEGACGPTLNCRRSFDIATLLRRPVVVELAGVGDNVKEQSLVTLLLMNAIRGHRRGATAAPPTPHVTILEEAHRVFPRVVPDRGGDTREANASALAAQRIAQGLAEDRKYRQGYILIDQQVTKVADEAYKITDLKVMHRTAATEDRHLLASTMTMHADQVEAAAVLAPFEAVISHSHLDQAVTVHVPDVRGQDATARGLPEAPLADDAELRTRHERLLTEPAFAEAMAPYDECHGCRHRCDFRTRAESVASDRQTIQRLSALTHLDQAAWMALAHHVVSLDASTPTSTVDPTVSEDYLVCLFIHLIRAVRPPGTWDDDDRLNAMRCTDLTRQQLAKARADRQ